MPFSSGRSVRAPASNATRTVTARVPGRSTRYSGSPLGSVEEWILAMAAQPWDAAARYRCREGSAAAGRIPCTSIDGRHRTPHQTAPGAYGARSAAPARGRRPRARRGHRLPLGHQEVPERRHRARRRHLRRPPRRVRVPRRLHRLGQVDDHAPADQGDRADLRLDRRRRPRPLRDHARQDPVLPAQPRRGLPGLQAAAQPDGARQRRLRAPGDRRLAARRAREGARTSCA